jgi:hypothetical protein
MIHRIFCFPDFRSYAPFISWPFKSVAAVFLLILLLWSTTITAQTETTWTWTGEAETTEWANPENWDQSTAPTLQGANIIQHIVIDFGEIETTGGREIGRNTRGATQTMSGGSLTINGTHRYGVLTGAEGSGVQTGGRIVSTSTFQLGFRDGAEAAYDLSGDASLEASHFAIASGGADTVATFNQSGGSLTANGTSGSFIGHLGQGTYNLSGGILSRNSASGISIAPGGAANGLLNQTGGQISLAGGGGLAVSPVNGGVGVYSITNGRIEAASLTVGLGASGTVNVGPNAEMNFSDGFSLAANGTVAFEFDAAGVSRMTFGGAGIIDTAGSVVVDGSVYTGSPQTFILIDAGSFDATPMITLNGFGEGTTYTWDEASGEFWIDAVAQVTESRLVPIGWYELQGIFSYEDAGAESWEALDDMDTTGHGMPNWQVYLGGTDPGDPLASFAIVEIELDSEEMLTLRWRGGLFGSDTPYLLDYSESLDPSSWNQFASRARQSGINEWTGSNPLVGEYVTRVFFRIRVTSDE